MKTKICTTIEQSRRLLELGLSSDTADFWYHSKENEYGPEVYVLVSKELTNGLKNDDFFLDDIPAWSLSRLLDLMPKVGYHEEGIHRDSYKGWNLDQFRLRYDAKVTLADFDRHGIYDYVDIAFKCIVWLIENGHIKL